MERKIYKNFDDAKEAYYNYLNDHISGVQKAFDIFGKNLCDYFAPNNPNMIFIVEDKVRVHDRSKYSNAELIPYIQKFNPWEGMNKSEEEVEKEFDIAWAHHYNVNKHHPEGWVIHTADGDDIVLKMTDDNIIEMMLDWISMSLIRNQSLYDWWINDDGGRNEKKYMMHPEVYEKVNTWVEDNKDTTDFTKS